MRRGRTLFFGSIISAVSLLVAPRVRGRVLRGSLATFAGTPCSTERVVAPPAAGEAGVAPPARPGAGPSREPAP